MSKQIIQLEHAFLNHRAKLNHIEHLSQTLPHKTQLEIALKLQNFDQLLDHLATAPPEPTISPRSNHLNNIP